MFGASYIRYVSSDVNQLWNSATLHCGSQDSWFFPVYISPEVPSERHAHLQGTHQATLVVTEDTESVYHSVPAPRLDIVPLISSGPSSNRIDFVFFGDGYTKNEKSKFVEDAKRLAFDLSNNQTFATVKPLLNFWAAFTPSNESGIGVGGNVNDTPFGLYRNGTELRVVYYAKPEVAHAACLSMGDMCDYPILLGNDPLYGGLGGRFTVTTSSKLNGALVLRHELGHSVIGEGEEYDGGFAYHGPNAANLTQPFKWQHWLTDNTAAVPREERSVMPIQAYPWTMLNDSKPWAVTFDSSGLYSRYVVRFSLSGLPKKDDLTVMLDGKNLHWNPKEGLGLDRWHYDIHINETLEAGTHSLSFNLENSDLMGGAQLCSMEVIEFGDSAEFNDTVGFIGAFPTYSEKNVTTYRPTNEDCLMRIVTTPTFCKVCIEGLWHALLRRMDLIDDISSGCVLGDDSSVKRSIAVKLVRLAQFREEPVAHSEAYIITWRKDGIEMPEFANQTSIVVDNIPANYSVQVEFATDEVRIDPNGYLRSTTTLEVTKCGGEGDNN
ncbi:uncharacterized protein FOMMEDRAFT_142576 [Fomitiporia mediterranea MF3/22]|uniref:uncharacterized protein n=1 Tax=Fomitiporia mediterranea (strain MF3/22) TaxID=694068 RepID=UPI0004407D4B|nr:uncharacterized protein FOMMEDRAFT_142576 [Fomitiporia mediterranea MF3/22]EJD00187.1 hypothetical protein FOMMEDRAFT_142576 [Fomitiporia mediterranea MF3/22]